MAHHDSARMTVISLIILAGTAAGCSSVGPSTVSVAPRGEQTVAATEESLGANERLTGEALADARESMGGESLGTNPYGYDRSRGGWALADPREGRFDPATAFAEETAGGAADNLDQLAQQTFAGEGADFDPNVSRDGRTLVFASTQHRPNPDLYIKAVGARTVTQLTSDPASDVMPELNPDGTRVAFASNRSGFWNIYVMPAAGGQAVQITTGQTQDLHPTWSPDGTRLAFCRLGQATGRWELWVVEVARPQVAEYLGLGLFPRWSPVASTGGMGRDRILFQRSRDRGDRAFSLWTIDYKPGDAGNPTEIIAEKGFAAINANWSPDASMITYALIPAETGGSAFQRGRSGEVWLASIDGAARSRLTSAGFVQSQPAWGGDGHVYFVSNRGGSDQVWSTSPVKALAGMGRTINLAGAAPMASPDAHGTVTGEAPVASVPESDGGNQR